MIVGEGLVGRRIHWLHRRLRKVTGSLQRGWHDRSIEKRAGYLAQPRIRAEEERLVFDYGPADGTSKLISV